MSQVVLFIVQDIEAMREVLKREGRFRGRRWYRAARCIERCLGMLEERDPFTAAEQRKLVAEDTKRPRRW